MRRALFALLLLALAAGGGLTAWARARAHAQYRVWLRSLASAPSVRVLDASYSPGWLRSRAQATFEVYGVAGALYRARLESLGRDTVRGRLGFLMEHEVEHGPLPFLRWLRDDRAGRPVVARVESRVDLDNETQAELAEVTGPLPGLRASTLVRADGAADGVFQAAPQRLAPRVPEERPVVLLGGRFKGLSGTLRLEPGGRAFALAFDSAGLEMTGPEHALAIAQWAVAIEARRDPGGPWVGRLQQGLGGLSWGATGAAAAPGAGPAASGFALRGLDWVQTSEARAGALRVAISLRAAGLDVAGQALGAGHAEWVARELDVRALSAWLRPAQDEDVAADQALADLLERSPILELTSLLLEGPAGRLEGAGHVVLRRRPAVAPGEGPVAVHVAAEFALPPAVAAALVGERRPALEKKGALASHADGERLRTRLEWEEGTWLANGVPVEIPLPRLRPAQVAEAGEGAPADGDPAASAEARDDAGQGAEDAASAAASEAPPAPETAASPAPAPPAAATPGAEQPASPAPPPAAPAP